MTTTSYPKGVEALLNGSATFTAPTVDIEFQPATSRMVVSAGGTELAWAEATEAEVKEAAAHLPDFTRLAAIWQRAGLKFAA